MCKFLHARRVAGAGGVGWGFSLQARRFQSTAASIEAVCYKEMVHVLKEIPYHSPTIPPIVSVLQFIRFWSIRKGLWQKQGFRRDVSLNFYTMDRKNKCLQSSLTGFKIQG